MEYFREGLKYVSVDAKFRGGIRELGLVVYLIL